MTESNNSPPIQEEYKELTEGQAKITFLGSAQTFYNPVQEFNRDLTQVLKLYKNRETLE